VQEPTTDALQNDPHKFLALIAYGRTTSNFLKDTTIFSRGDAADSVYFIQDGRVRVTIASGDGKQTTVAILEEGEFFGESCLGNQDHRIATMTALTDCRLTCIEKAAMNETLQIQPEFARFFMRHLLSKNIRIERSVIDHLFNSSERRLARRLLVLANYGQDGNLPVVPVTVSEEKLAELVGTTRSSIDFFLSNFRERGFIDYENEIVVHPSLLNFVLSD
jgi:CRP/FNR family transcriptional regulator, cyclic AMP receptor protein